MSSRKRPAVGECSSHCEHLFDPVTTNTGSGRGHHIWGFPVLRFQCGDHMCSESHTGWIQPSGQHQPQTPAMGMTVQVCYPSLGDGGGGGSGGGQQKDHMTCRITEFQGNPVSKNSVWHLRDTTWGWPQNTCRHRRMHTCTHTQTPLEEDASKPELHVSAQSAFY